MRSGKPSLRVAFRQQTKQRSLGIDGKKHVHGAPMWVPQDFVGVADTFKRRRLTVGRVLLHLAQVRAADRLVAGIGQNAQNLSRILVQLYVHPSVRLQNNSPCSAAARSRSRRAFLCRFSSTWLIPATSWAISARLNGLSSFSASFTYPASAKGVRERA